MTELYRSQGYREQVMAISVISVSLDSSEESTSSSSSSSESYSDSSANALSDSASSHSSSDHSLPHYHRESRRLLGFRGFVRRIVFEPICEPYVPREAGLGVDFEDESSGSSRHRGTHLEMDVDVMRSDGIDIDLEIQAEIGECIAYADALRDKGIDARVVVKAIDQEEIETSMRGPVKVRVDRVTHPVVVEDILKPSQEGAVEVTYETLGDLVQRIVATGQQSADMSERIRELERDNMRLRDMMDVASQRVARSQRRELRVQREMRQIRRFRFYDRMRIARLEACAKRHLGYRS
ncbi:hypothetical protein Tco_0077507 [Tanacetum coccineum]